MAVVTVEIELPGVAPENIVAASDWMCGDKVVIDEVYLERYVDDDSFFAFKLVAVRP